jgi:MFS family permease
MPLAAVFFDCGGNNKPTHISSMLVANSTMTTSERKPHRSKMLLLLWCSLIPFGAHFVKQMMGPLKPFFEELGMSSTEFGLLLSASMWPNVVHPFTSYYFVDAYGRGALVFAALTVIGQAAFACSFSPDGSPPARDLLSGAIWGRALFGFGQGGLTIVQNTTVAFWFKHNVVFAIGVTESARHVANFLGRALPMMVVLHSSLVVGMWFGVLVLGCSLAATLGFVLTAEMLRPFEFALAKSGYGSMSRGASADPGDSAMSFSLELLKALPGTFWGVAVLHLLYSNISSVFASFSTSLFMEEFGLQPQVAALYVRCACVAGWWRLPPGTHTRAGLD